MQSLAGRTKKARAASGWEACSAGPGAGRVGSDCQGSLDFFLLLIIIIFKFFFKF